MSLTQLQKSLKLYQNDYNKVENKEKVPEKMIIHKLPKLKEGLKKLKFQKRYQHSKSYLQKNNKKEEVKALDLIKREISQKEDYLEYNRKIVEKKIPKDPEIAMLKDHILNYDVLNKKRIKILKKKPKSKRK